MFWARIWGLKSKDSNVLGFILGPPTLGNYQITLDLGFGFCLPRKNGALPQCQFPAKAVFNFLGNVC